MIAVERLAASDIERELAALARLRIEVFRAFPYLYEGSLEYESKYLAGFARSPRATLVVARDDGVVVGASTAMPVLDSGEADVLSPPLERAGFAAGDVYYFGESVLLSRYRGRGLGGAFFDHREAAARELGYRVAAFCAVERPFDHPLRPADYTPLDAFWTRRGYRKRPDITAAFTWRDLDQPLETAKPMVFWVKELA